MKMDIVAGSGNDEFYTPATAVLPILPFVQAASRIWCPFDTEDSNFVKTFKELGHSVRATHLLNGQDFFSTEPRENEIAISNPPYSKKTEVLDRLFKLKVKFAMLVGVVGLFESKRRFTMFANNSFEILYLSRRVSYLKNSYDTKPSLNPPFSSVYLCSGLLPRQIMFAEVSK